MAHFSKFYILSAFLDAIFNTGPILCFAEVAYYPCMYHYSRMGSLYCYYMAIHFNLQYKIGSNNLRHTLLEIKQEKSMAGRMRNQDLCLVPIPEWVSAKLTNKMIQNKHTANWVEFFVQTLDNQYSRLL